MVKEYKIKFENFMDLSLKLGLFGILGSGIVGIWLPESVAILLCGIGGALFAFLHFALFTIACICYAQAKRQSPAWGALGLLSLLGLIVLICLKDKSKEE